MSTYIDLKIIDDDLELDTSGNPVFVFDRDVIAQDVRHAIRESGLLFELIGERRPANRKLTYNKVKTLVEDDERVIPGSCSITEEDTDAVFIFADTEFGPVDVSVSA